MTRNQKLLSVLLCVMMTLLCACAAPAQQPDATETPAQPAATETPAVEAAALYTPGTYTATVNGRNGPLTVEVTFSETAIVSAEVTDHIETANIGDVPAERIPKLVVENQSLGIDAVSAATITSEAVLSAIAACVTQAGGDVEALKAVPVASVQAGDAVKMEADVIVIGGGGAGMAAAVSAARGGASVIVVEKTAALGGNTIRSGGSTNAVYQPNCQNSEIAEAQRQPLIDEARSYAGLPAVNDTMARWQENLTRELDEYAASNVPYLFDSIWLHMIQTYDGGDYVGDPALIESFCTNAVDTYTWLADMGFPWKPSPVIIQGSLWQRSQASSEHKSGIGFINVLKETADKEALPIEYVFEAPANELVVENNRVTAVKSTSTVDGTEYLFKASKGVVLATGGFGANIEMRVKYNTKWPNLGEDVGTTNSPACTGDGIVMAEAIGAGLTGMEYIQLLPLTGVNVGDESGLTINAEGKRFVNETSRRDVYASAILEQPGSMCYLISSQQGSRIDENGINYLGYNVDQCVEEGTVFRADTLEDLAKQINVEPSVLIATVEQFNKACETGVDELFGRSIFNATAAIEDHGPYYASPARPKVHHTMGGVQVDTEARVLRADGRAIAGLYAAGEVTGGFHGSNRLGGNAVSECLTTGRIAGLTILKDNG